MEYLFNSCGYRIGEYVKYNGSIYLIITLTSDGDLVLQSQAYPERPSIVVEPTPTTMWVQHVRHNSNKAG